MQNLFEYYVETAQFHFKYAKGEPAVKEQEFHYYHEFVLFLEGSSYLISKNIQQTLVPGSVVLIPKEQFHQFCVSTPLEYKRCILGFRETPELAALIDAVMTEVKVISVPDSKIMNLFQNLMDAMESDLTEEELQLHVRAALIQFLLYFKQYHNREISSNVTISPIVQHAICYIDKNFTKKLTVNSIAEHLFVSPSTLAHKFSEELNIPIYQYISKKRLLSVHKLVESGETYAEAATKSGFSDYSCFYRIYKKYS